MNKFKTSGIIKKLKKVQLEILLSVVDICDRNGIRYYLIGGTLLGAVRHKGFIPWDDDIDIAMLRDDYEKFSNCWENENPDDLVMQNKEKDERVHQSFTKIRKKGTKLVEKETMHSGIFKGIAIDIFPLDKIPEKDNLFLKFNYTIYRFLMSVCLYKNGYRSYRSTTIKTISFLSSFLSFKQINRLSYSIITRYRNSDINFCTSYASGYGYTKYRKEIKKHYDDGVYLPFEGHLFRCPSNYKEYLRDFFGDYMKLPPANERVSRHHYIEIDFGGN